MVQVWSNCLMDERARQPDSWTRWQASSPGPAARHDLEDQQRLWARALPVDTTSLSLSLRVTVTVTEALLSWLCLCWPWCSLRPAGGQRDKLRLGVRVSGSGKGLEFNGSADQLRLELELEPFSCPAPWPCRGDWLSSRYLNVYQWHGPLTLSSLCVLQPCRTACEVQVCRSDHVQTIPWQYCWQYLTICTNLKLFWQYDSMTIPWTNLSTNLCIDTTILSTMLLTNLNTVWSNCLIVLLSE